MLVLSTDQYILGLSKDSPKTSWDTKTQHSDTFGEEPAQNTKLKPQIDAADLHAKLNGFYIITESRIIPIKTCVGHGGWKTDW